MIIAYLRVSTDGQAEHGFGLNVQRERIDAYARSQGWTINDYVVDDGYSGAKDDRPGLIEMKRRIEANEVTKVIVYKLDRLSRELRLLLDIYDDVFEANHVALVSVSEHFDTSTPAGRMFFEILGSFAGYERRTIVERLKGGRVAKAKTGQRACGATPYGYTTFVGVDKRSMTVIDDGEANVIRLIFDKRSGGASLQSIADTLNRERIATPGRSNEWRVGTIHAILGNPIYRGIVTYEVDGTKISEENRELAIIA